MNNITVLIISHDRPEFLKENLASLMKFNTNIFVVVNGFNEQTVNFLTSTKKHYNYLDFTVFEEQTNKSKARNKGVEKIQSEIIYFLDDDAFIDKNNIEILQKKFLEYPFAEVIGGPNITPPTSSRFQKLSGILLSTYLISYKMNARYFAKGVDRLSDETELILCNLAIKKNAFTKHNLKFNELLHYNEENLLLEQLKKFNTAMLYSPDLFVYHHRRATLKSFLEQIYNSGKGRAVMTVIMPSSIKIFFLFPTLFLIYMICAIFDKMTFILLNAYLFITLYNVISAYFIHKLKLLDITIMFIVSILSHLTYGWGFVVGLIKGIIWKMKKNF